MAPAMVRPEADDFVFEVADEVLDALAAGRQIASISARRPGFDLAAAYRVTAAVRAKREARGERPIGRKLGFTNRNIWNEYQVFAPIWGYVYDTTVECIAPSGAAFDLARVVEPRIEPEITLAFSRAPEPGMDEAELLECVAWVAHGFEVVQSLFPGWKFSPADTVAAFALHGALLLGPGHAVTATNREEWLRRLGSFTLTLSRLGAVMDRGVASNVLGGPLSAIRNVVAVLAHDPFNPPIAAGEIVTTGTVTRAFPMNRGDIWNTAIAGAPFEGLNLALR